MTSHPMTHHPSTPWSTLPQGAERHQPGARPRFLSEADCHEIAQRLARFAVGGGETQVHIVSRWTGNVRWARNQMSTTGEDRDNQILVTRSRQGATSYNIVQINDVSDAALVAAARRAERLVQDDHEMPDADLAIRPGSPFSYQDDAPEAIPQLFYEATYQLDAAQRAEAARRLMRSAAAAGMLSAGYIEVSATSTAYITSWGYAQYYQYTWAQYSVTVRDPKGVGSGWAGVDWPDWSKIDGEALSAVALDKCLHSRNPVAVEPGRYTTILEPQAVCDFISPWGFENSRPAYGEKAPFGERVIDARLTVRADPMDPEDGFPPYEKRKETQWDGPIFHPATWIERGVWQHLPYYRNYGIGAYHKDPGLPQSGAFRIMVDGPTTSIAEMIATTKRGLLVTRFNPVTQLGPILYRGYTRDGLWLIENGKISKAVKNMTFVESVLFALNNVEQLGAPQRTFRPIRGGPAVWRMDPQPVVVPAMKIRDFSFTALSDAI